MPARRDPFGLLERVLNTMAEARALSTRCLYALKWSVFSTWIRSPPMCQWFSHFCRRCWINGAPHPPSTFTRLAIAAFHAPITGEWWAEIVRWFNFYEAPGELNPPRPRTVPPWDLPTVLGTYRLYSQTPRPF